MNTPSTVKNTTLSPQERKAQLEKQIDEMITAENISEHIQSPYMPQQVIKAARKEIKEYDREKNDGITPANSMYKALTLAEYSNGILLSLGFSEEEKAFAIQMSEKLQKEYDCKTESQRATAELVALNFCRIHELQKLLHSCISKDVTNAAYTKRVNIISTELDRAERHYLASLQALQQFNQPPFQISVKAQQNNFLYQHLQKEKEEFGLDVKEPSETIIETK